MIRVMLPAFVALALSTGAARAQQAPPENSQKPVPSQEELEKQFAETLSGATLVGNFTIAGVNADKPPKEDRYTLGKVSKLKNDFWSIEARIQYGNHDVKLPLAVQVRWAGDTPVITVTDVAFPGLGTYTARVLFYRGQYAGTWSGGDHGGQMFGKIVKADAAEKAPTEPPAGGK